MARPTERPTRRAVKAPPRRSAQKPCTLCNDKVEWVDYKNVNLLRGYMSDRGKIRARQVTGNCTRHQGEISVAIKTARDLVLLPRGDTHRNALGHANGHVIGQVKETESSEPLEMVGATGGGRR